MTKSLFLIGLLLGLSACVAVKKNRKASQLQAAGPTANAELNNIFGAHLLASSEDRINQQIQWAKHLVGPRGYVKNLFTGIDAQRREAKPEWIHFVKSAYEANLIPICRLAGHHNGRFWEKPMSDGGLDYTSMANAIRDIVKGLPQHEELPLYIEIWNEPHLPIEWSMAPSVEEYAHFLQQVSDSIRSLELPNVRILNAGLSPLKKMGEILPESLDSFDVLSSHPYPHNQPPSVNLKDGTVAQDRREFTIDAYRDELKIMQQASHHEMPVMISETGYNLGNRLFSDFPMINEKNRARYMVEAFRDHWLKSPEILAVTPFLLSAGNEWSSFEWVPPTSASDADGRPLEASLQYEYVSALAKVTENWGSVSGRILAKDSGAPISKAKLQMRNSNKSFQTDEDGFYIIGKLGFGPQILEVSHADFKDQQATIRTDKESQNLAQDIYLSELKKINISGKILDEADQALNAVTIRLSPGKMNSQTDAEGLFSLVTSPGVYELILKKPGYATIFHEIEISSEQEKNFPLHLTLSRLPIPEENNLLVNSTFEDEFPSGLASGWQSRDGQLHPSVFRPEGDQYISGHLSQAVDLAAGISLIEQWTPYNSISPGKVYLLSAWVKRTNHSSSSPTLPAQSNSFKVLAVFMTNNSQAVGLLETTIKEEKKNGWVRLEGRTSAPVGAQRAMIEVGAKENHGILLIDDVFFGRDP